MSDGAPGGAVHLQRLPAFGAGAPVSAAPLLVYAPVVAHARVTPEYWLLTLEAPEMARRAQPGQFAMLTLAREGENAPVLPRPMALYLWDTAAGTVQVLYRIVGEGTRALSTWRPGEIMASVGPLGRGFALLPGTRSCLLVGRGIGICSLTALAREAAHRGISVHAISSARRRDSLIGRDLYEAVGVRTLTEVVDEDGSSALHALRPRLEDLLRQRPVDQVFVCGSERLLALAADLGGRAGARVQVSLEAHMACGLGYCHGCSTGHPGLAEEAPLVCKDGPVFACAGVGAA